MTKRTIQHAQALQREHDPFIMKNVVSALALLALILSASVYVACEQKSDFQYASKAYQLSFPKDHAAHHGFRTEWQYYTGHLRSTDGQRFGYELTFFRTALSLSEVKSSDNLAGRKQLYFAHFAITDETNRQFYHAEKQSRGSFGDADASENYYKTFIGNWSAQQLGNYTLLQAETDTLSLVLILDPLKPVVLQGDAGYSRKGEDEKNASMYYSYTRLKTTGAISILGNRYTVEGESWNDHEFSTSALDKNSIGWDWFSIQFSDSTELMLYQVRQRDGSAGKFSSGTFVRADGSTEKLSVADFTISPMETYTSKKTGAVYPSKWKLSIPKLAMDLVVTPTVQDQELLTKESTRISYWEGSSTVSGTRQGNPLSGNAYVELTGYAQPLSF